MLEVPDTTVTLLELAYRLGGRPTPACIHIAQQRLTCRYGPSRAQIADASGPSWHLASNELTVRHNMLMPNGWQCDSERLTDRRHR